MDLDETGSVEDSENDEFTTAAEVVKKLEEVWVNEKLAPELLQYEGELVDCLLDQVQHMENSLQAIKKEDFRMIVHKMELDRIKFVLNSYLRTRLEKIEKFGAHLLHLEQQGRIDSSHMSKEERDFAQRSWPHEFRNTVEWGSFLQEISGYNYSYVGSIKNYLHDTALKHMPANMQTIKLEDMCSKPLLDYSVFIKVKKDCKGILIEETAEYGDEEIIDLNEGSQHILRYKPIVPLLKEGSIQLI